MTFFANMIFPFKEFKAKEKAEIGLRRLKNLQTYLSLLKADPRRQELNRKLAAEIGEIETQIPLAESFFKSVRRNAQVGMGLKITLIALTALSVSFVALTPPLVGLSLVIATLIIGPLTLINGAFGTLKNRKLIEQAENALFKRLPWGNLAEIPTKAILNSNSKSSCPSPTIPKSMSIFNN